MFSVEDVSALISDIGFLIRLQLAEMALRKISMRINLSEYFAGINMVPSVLLFVVLSLRSSSIN